MDSNKMETIEEAQSVLLGVYKNMTNQEIYGYYLSMLFTLPTDQAKVEGSSIDSWRRIASNAYTSSAAEVQETWQALYAAIYSANNFIEKLSLKVENFNEADKRKAAVYMAEARGLRALYYFELVRWFGARCNNQKEGGIVLIKSTAQSYQHPSTFTQATATEVYEFIEQDLKYAISVLPYANEDRYRTNNAYRLSKGSVLGLLTKVYATWAGYPVQDESKWELAAKTAKTLIDSGQHGLLEDYNDLWIKTANGEWDPKESLIEVSFYSPTKTGNRFEDASGKIGKWNGVDINKALKANCNSNSGRWRVLPPFLEKWRNTFDDETVDKRWAISFADYRYKAEGKTPISKLTFEEAMEQSDKRKEFNNGIFPGKWDIIKYANPGNMLNDANDSNTNWYLLRYADVLLLYAEALNEWHKSPTKEAYDAVNLVRRRGYGEPLGSYSKEVDLAEGMSYSEFQKAVRDERSHELAFEGHRRQDLTRWGIYTQSIARAYNEMSMWDGDEGTKVYKAAEYTIEGKHELLPIPLRDLDLMTGCTQNPNW